MFHLDNKIAVITGGGSGIGRAMSLLFARQGAMVHILDLDPDESVSMVRKEKGKVLGHSCNVGGQVEVSSVMESIGTFHILINNAGIAHVGTAENTSEEEFDKLMLVNVKGVYNCIHSAIPFMRKAGGGCIINMASIAGQSGLADRFAYSVTKGAIMAMTLSVAKDFIGDNIRCNSISPARVHTPFVDGFLQKNYPGHEKEMFDKLSATQPIGRMAEPAEVAALALYLCSDEASFITGCDYPIDGGFLKLNT